MNGEAKNANPSFVQSTQKAVRACKLFRLHYCKLHMSKKLREWGSQKRKPFVCAINAQSGTSLQIVPPPPSPYNAGNGNSRKYPANPTPEQSLHYCKLHMSKKLREWGSQKRKPLVCAINAQSGTRLQIVPPPPSPYNAGNGN